MGIDGYQLCAVGGGRFCGFQYAVGDARRGFEAFLSPVVGYCFVVPEGALLLHVATVHVANGPYLLVHGHTE